MLFSHWRERELIFQVIDFRKGETCFHLDFALKSPIRGQNAGAVTFSSALCDIDYDCETLLKHTCVSIIMFHYKHIRDKNISILSNTMHRTSYILVIYYVIHKNLTQANMHTDINSPLLVMYYVIHKNLTHTNMHTDTNSPLDTRVSLIPHSRLPIITSPSSCYTP